MRLVAAQAKDSATTIYGATFGSVEETGRRWGHCTRQAGWGLNSQIHAVGDGADWIRRQSQEVFRGQGAFLCDFYHVSEYLGAAALSCRPTQPDPLAPDAAEAPPAGRGPESDGSIGAPSGAGKHGGEGIAGAQWLSLFAQPVGLLGLSSRSGPRTADWIGHDRERTPPCAPGTPQESGHSLVTRTRRPDRTLTSPQGQPPMGFLVELIITHFQPHPEHLARYSPA